MLLLSTKFFFIKDHLYCKIILHVFLIFNIEIFKFFNQLMKTIYKILEPPLVYICNPIFFPFSLVSFEAKEEFKVVEVNVGINCDEGKAEAYKEDAHIDGAWWWWWSCPRHPCLTWSPSIGAWSVVSGECLCVFMWVCVHDHRGVATLSDWWIRGRSIERAMERDRKMNI